MLIGQWTIRPMSFHLQFCPPSKLLNNIEELNEPRGNMYLICIYFWVYA